MISAPPASSRSMPKVKMAAAFLMLSQCAEDDSSLCPSSVEAGSISRDLGEEFEIKLIGEAETWLEFSSDVCFVSLDCGETIADEVILSGGIFNILLIVTTRCNRNPSSFTVLRDEFNSHSLLYHGAYKTNWNSAPKKANWKFVIL